MAHARRRADGGVLRVVEPYFIPDSWLAWGIFFVDGGGGSMGGLRNFFQWTKKYFLCDKKWPRRGRILSVADTAGGQLGCRCYFFLPIFLPYYFEIIAEKMFYRSLAAGWHVSCSMGKASAIRLASR